MYRDEITILTRHAPSLTYRNSESYNHVSQNLVFLVILHIRKKKKRKNGIKGTVFATVRREREFFVNRIIPADRNVDNCVHSVSDKDLISKFVSWK